MLSLRWWSPPSISTAADLHSPPNPRCSNYVVCAAKGPRPRYPRVWKSKKRVGTISKSLKLVECIKDLSNVKEEVYGALDSFIAWELEFPLITVKKALKILENEREWKRIIQVSKWMLSKGQGRTMGSYYALLNALAEDGRLDEAEELWARLFSDNLESMPRIFFERMISIYYQREMHDKMFEVFADMEELGIHPTTNIVKEVGDVFQKLGMLDKYKKLKKKYPPPKWEYRYFKGKRVKIRSKQNDESGNASEELDNTGEETDEFYENENKNVDESLNEFQGKVDDYEVSDTDCKESNNFGEERDNSENVDAISDELPDEVDQYEVTQTDEFYENENVDERLNEFQGKVDDYEVSDTDCKGSDNFGEERDNSENVDGISDELPDEVDQYEVTEICTDKPSESMSTSVVS